MKTVDSSGVVVNAYEYDMYGTLRSSSGSQDNEFQFAGQQTDPSGLQYLRARYYANATNLSDPLGLCSRFKPRLGECGVWGAAGGVTAGGFGFVLGCLAGAASTDVAGFFDNDGSVPSASRLREKP